MTDPLELQVSELLESFRGQMNTPELRDEVINVLYAFFNANVTVMQYDVLCSERNNTPESIDRNELWVHFVVKRHGELESTRHGIKLGPQEALDVQSNSN